MKYSKVANYILKNYYKGKKMLIQKTQSGNLVCLDNVMILRFPDIFPFNTEIFEEANLEKMIEAVFADSVEAKITKQIIQHDKYRFYVILDEKGRNIYIDTRYLDLLGIDEPLFRVSEKSVFMPVLVYDGQLPTLFHAAICPARIE